VNSTMATGTGTATVIPLSGSSSASSGILPDEERPKVLASFREPGVPSTPGES
jgi:hypothetical protein